MNLPLANCSKKGTKKLDLLFSSFSSQIIEILVIDCRMKTRKVPDKTLYCLSPKELLQTAEEVLEEVQCKNDVTFYYRFVLRQHSIFFFPFC